MWLATGLVVLVALTATLVFALGAFSSLPGSPFEATDGNLVSNGGPDWAVVTEQRKNDLPTGQTDDSFGQGTKEDTPVPTVVAGQIPNNKSDLKTFGVYNQPGGTAGFMELFWTRVQDPNGTTNIDFEFNQSSTISANGKTPVRTAGDVLIQYDLDRGGTVPTLSKSVWVTSGAASQCEANNAVPCWSHKVNLTSGGLATGSINQNAILAADSDGLGALGARTFGEAEVDLAALGGRPNSCITFGSAYAKSRSSSSFTAEVKDFIAPESISVGNCGHVIIRKVTDPADPAETQFGYHKSINTSPATPNTFSLGDGQSQTYNTVLQGNGYTVSEDAPPAGWDFDSIDCSASSGVSPSIVGTQITFNIDSASDVLDCTYHNRARGTIIIRKVADDGDGSFDFSSSTLSPSPFTLTTAAPSHADQRTFSNLVPGSYDAAESVPAGWHIVGTPSCDDGSSPLAISLQGGETVTCTWHDARDKGGIDILKLRKHAADGPGDHPQPGVVFTVTGGELPQAGVQVTTDANGQACVDGLVVSSLVGDYTVTESVPSGYHNVGGVSQTATVSEAATCSSGNRPLKTFHNIPLTNISISVDSQVDGGTASHIDCDGNTADTGANGDGSLSRTDLEPGTYTCVVTVDP